MAENDKRKINIVVAAIALVMGIALIAGATFAWMSFSKNPNIENLNIRIEGDEIVDIALADASEFDLANNKATGPCEVTVSDFEKGQTTWGKTVDVSDELITLQAPATFATPTEADGAKALATVRYDETGRTDGFEALKRGNVTDAGLVYYTKDIQAGETYVDKEGHIVTAESANPDDVPSAAGGVAVWVRSNVATTTFNAVFDKVTILTTSRIENTQTEDGEPATVETEVTDVPVEMIINFSKLNEESKDPDTGAITGTLEKIGTFQCTKGVNGEGDSEFTADINAGFTGNLEAGQVYLAEILVYIEGNKEESQLALSAAKMGQGGIKASFDGGSIGTNMIIPMISLVNEPEMKKGWYTEMPTLKISLAGAPKIEEGREINISYKLINTKTAAVLADGFFAVHDIEDSEILNITEDGTYAISVWLTDSKNMQGGEYVKYYVAEIGAKRYITTNERNIPIYVDTSEPDIEFKDTYTGFFKDPLTVKAKITEENISTVSIDGATVARRMMVDGTVEISKTYYKDGEYTSTAKVTDKAGRSKEVTTAFTMDLTKPELDGFSWRFVNDDASSAFLSALTGDMFFNKSVVLTATATDKNLDTITWSTDGGPALAGKVTKGKKTVEEREVDDETKQIAEITIPDDFYGTIVISARDKAGNVTEHTTGVMCIDDAEFATGVVSDLDGTSDKNINFTLSKVGEGHTRIDHYEYSFDGETWIKSDTTVTIDSCEVTAFYGIGEDEIPGSRITVEAEADGVVDTTIYFRAVSTTAEEFDMTGKVTKYRTSDSTEAFDIKIDRRPKEEPEPETPEPTE